MVEHQAEGLIVVGEAHRLLPAEILRETVLEHSIMLWRQSDGEIDIQCGSNLFASLQFLRYGKQRQQIETVVLGLVPHNGQPLANERPVPALIPDDVRCHGRFGGKLLNA